MTPRRTSRERALDAMVVRTERYIARYHAGRLGRYGVRVYLNRWGWQVIHWFPGGQYGRTIVFLIDPWWRRVSDGPRERGARKVEWWM